MDKKIIYPQALTRGSTIAITAPSSGVENHLHHLLELARTTIQNLGFNVIEGKTIWSNDKCVSASKEKRANELMNFLQNDNVNAIIPPWGGEFLMDILPLLDWVKLGQLSPKWILGYSDISTFTFAYTLLTGIATAHGTNYIDLNAGELNSTSQRWVDVLQTNEGETIEQYSSKMYQSKWDFNNRGFNLDTPTEWKMLDQQKAGAKEVSFSGRLLGGCMDTISILLGTSYAPVNDFISHYCSETGVIWYLESCEMNASDIYRHLWQMKQCRWFDNTNGILLGRAAGYAASKNFELIDALTSIFSEMNIPVIYDVDIGHVPPQMTLVNGAFANVTYNEHKGTVTMSFI